MKRLLTLLLLCITLGSTGAFAQIKFGIKGELYGRADKESRLGFLAIIVTFKRNGGKIHTTLYTELDLCECSSATECDT